nr:MAG TPA: hypothetical protein [Caudoviricetes sp.]
MRHPLRCLIETPIGGRRRLFKIVLSSLYAFH